MLTFIKLGGSLITDKNIESSYREDVVRRVGLEVREAFSTQQLLIGHGSGSFGHFAAKRYDTINGVHSAEEWRGFAEVAAAAALLNHHVATTLRDLGLPIIQIQPSASAQCENGEIRSMASAPITKALENNLLPLVYGDVAFDSSIGGTIISTETIFFYLTAILPVTTILLLGEVDGVFDETGSIIPRITPSNFTSIAAALGGSAGVDVTGGMASKVSDMVRLTQIKPGLAIRIMSGTQPGLLQDTLTGKAAPGTLITASDGA